MAATLVVPRVPNARWGEQEVRKTLTTIKTSILVDQLFILGLRWMKNQAAVPAFKPPTRAINYII